VRTVGAAASNDTQECVYPNSLWYVYNQCQGHNECTLNVDPSSFGNVDRCPGVSKYLQVSYECTPKRRFICENDVDMIVCPVGRTIRVRGGNFGQRGTAPQCLNNVPSVSDCVSSNADAILEETCNGRRTCFLRAVSTIYGDACVGVGKYLEVDYECGT